MVIVISDLNLDDQAVLAKLEVVFAGYESVGVQAVRCGRQVNPFSLCILQPRIPILDSWPVVSTGKQSSLPHSSPSFFVETSRIQAFGHLPRAARLS